MNKNIIFTIGICVLIFGFNGCSSNQLKPFDPNLKTIVFIENQPYRIPHNVKYFPLLTEHDEKLFKVNGIHSCTINSLLWNSDISDGTLYKLEDSAYMSLSYRMAEGNTIDHVTFGKLKNDSCEGAKDCQMLKDEIRTIPDNITVATAKKNRELMDKLFNGGTIFMVADRIRKGLSGCASKMSNKEFEYYRSQEKLMEEVKYLYK